MSDEAVMWGWDQRLAEDASEWCYPDEEEEDEEDEDDE